MLSLYFPTRIIGHNFTPILLPYSISSTGTISGVKYTPTITPVQNVFVGDDLYFGSYNEGSVHKLTLSGKNFDKAEKDEIVYKSGKPWNVIGVFYGTDNNFYVTTPTGITSFTPKVQGK